MSSLLFYDKPVALNKKAHQDLKLKSLANFSFASNTNSVILAGVEFTEAAKEYPIVFAEAGDNLVPVALLGETIEPAGRGNDRTVGEPREADRFPEGHELSIQNRARREVRAVCVDLDDVAGAERHPLNFSGVGEPDRQDVETGLSSRGQE